MTRPKRVLLLSEPAPYVLDFLRVLRGVDDSDCEVLFVDHRFSQPWFAPTRSSQIALSVDESFMGWFMLGRTVRQ